MWVSAGRGWSGIEIEEALQLWQHLNLELNMRIVMDEVASDFQFFVGIIFISLITET